MSSTQNINKTEIMTYTTPETIQQNPITLIKDVANLFYIFALIAYRQCRRLKKNKINVSVSNVRAEGKFYPKLIRPRIRCVPEGKNLGGLNLNRFLIFQSGFRYRFSEDPICYTLKQLQIPSQKFLSRRERHKKTPTHPSHSRQQGHLAWDSLCYDSV